MKKQPKTPKVKRTRRHVVVRFTPDEANAAFLLAAQSLVTAKHGRRVVGILLAASKAGETELPPAPRPTSITRGMNLFRED